MNDQRPLFRITNPATSRAAAESLSVEGLQASERRVLEVLHAMGTAADYRLERALVPEYSNSRVRTARLTLERAGRVEWTGETEQGPRGSRCRTWRVVR